MNLRSLSQELMIRKYVKVETKNSCLGEHTQKKTQTGNSFDYKPATCQSHQIPSSLEDIDKGLTHTPELFYRKQTHTRRKLPTQARRL